ncbi:MAG: transient receptor potential channel pyrexia-like, partial [Chthonomonadales bacterium]|nr:transient receptor potential channel pyrexia-like [Chthonomonadales bacterium]
MSEQVLTLHLAVEAEDFMKVRLLLEQGAEIDARNEGGYTPLHLAATHYVPDIADYLLAHGADIHSRDRSGKTALDMAAWYGRLEATRLLLEKGV